MFGNFKNRRGLRVLALATAAFGGAMAQAAFGPTDTAFADPPTHAAERPAYTPPAGGGALASVSESLADLTEAVTPSVVRIVVRIPDEGALGAAQGLQELPEPFRRFFEPGTPDRQGPSVRVGGGTGFIVSDEGYVVTNDHVVGDAEEITVILNDGRSLSASLVGTDPTTDVAVVKIEAPDLVAVPWGSSADLRVGEWVLAIGNPGVGAGGPLDYSVTTGIVSAKGRPLQLIGRSLRQDPAFGDALAGYAIENFIQTDAVINPGNSGGPMLDMNGTVVGMNSAIASTDGHYQGYGFAIPSDLVRKVAQDLIDYGAAQRAWLGVQVTRVSPEDAEAFGLPAIAGVVVQSTTEDGPGADAGLEQGDVITELDGMTIGSGGDLQQLVAEHSKGDEVTLTVYRDGKARRLDVTLGDSPISRSSAEHRSGPRPAASRSGEVRKLGLTLAPLDDAQARQLGLDRTKGVVIADVSPDGPAAPRGVVPGLVLEQVGDHRVRDVADAVEALDQVASGSVVTLHLRGPDGLSRIVNVRAR
jgi:serine protease Do